MATRSTGARARASLCPSAMCIGVDVRAVVLAFVAVVSALSTSVEGATSYTWGHVNKYAMILYDEEIYLNAAQNGSSIEVSYPPVGTLSDYTITAMHAFNMLALDDEEVGDATSKTGAQARALLLCGGIGYNYTTVRFYTEPPYLHDIYFKFTVYGLDL